jgi:hypothetical protein
VFEGGGHGGALISVRAALRSFKAWLPAAVSSILSLEGSRRDAARGRSVQDMPKAHHKQSAYEGAVQQDCEKFYLCAAAADRLFDIQALYLG